MWKLSAADLCEIARTSVLNSDFPHDDKQHWLGDTYWLAGTPGRAVQLDSMKPMLKAPGYKRSKLRYDELLASFAFKFNMRRYIRATTYRRPTCPTCASSSATTCSRSGRLNNVHHSYPETFSPHETTFAHSHTSCLVTTHSPHTHTRTHPHPHTHTPCVLSYNPLYDAESIVKLVAVAGGGEESDQHWGGAGHQEGEGAARLVSSDFEMYNRLMSAVVAVSAVAAVAAAVAAVSPSGWAGLAEAAGEPKGVRHATLINSCARVVYFFG